MTAAIPGRSQRDAPTVHRAHPHDEQALGCPVCGNTTELRVTYQVTMTVQAAAWRVDLVTQPEVWPWGETAQHEPPPDLNRPTKVACAACRWSYTGPDPLGKLVAT